MFTLSERWEHERLDMWSRFDIVDRLELQHVYCPYQLFGKTYVSYERLSPAQHLRTYLHVGNSWFLSCPANDGPSKTSPSGTTIAWDASETPPRMQLWEVKDWWHPHFISKTIHGFQSKGPDGGIIWGTTGISCPPRKTHILILNVGGKINFLTSWFYHMSILHQLTHPISWGRFCDSGFLMKR